MNRVIRKAALAAVGVAATVVGVTAQAPAALAADDALGASAPQPRPWELGYRSGHASGVSTVSEPFGVSRTYVVKGTVQSNRWGECYFVQGSTDAFVPFQNSPSSCGAPVTFTFTLLKKGHPLLSPTLRLCRGDALAAKPDCGPVIFLGGGI